MKAKQEERERKEEEKRKERGEERKKDVAASWISEWNDFSKFASLCHCDAFHQVSAQSDLGFRRLCRLKNFKMAALAAILDIRTKRF